MSEIVLDDVRKLSVEERLKLIEGIWGTITVEDTEIPLSAEDQVKLSRRYEDYLQTPDEGSSWEEVKARIQARNDTVIHMSRFAAAPLGGNK